MSLAMRKQSRKIDPPALRADLAKLLGLTVLFVLALLLTACASGLMPLTIG